MAVCPGRNPVPAWKKAAVKAFMVVNTLIFVPGFLVVSLFRNQYGRIRAARWWSILNLAWIRWLTGIRLQVEGLEHFPQDRPVILCVNHQSMLETMFLQEILPPFVWVLKRELLRIPLFGWGLKAIGPIAIDRSRGKEARQQILQQGREKLEQGLSILLFPEGTRTQPGERRGFRKGIASLAAATGADIVPIAHNSGCVWPGKSFLQNDGVVYVRIGKPMTIQGLNESEILQQCQDWVYAQLDELEALPGHPEA